MKDWSRIKISDVATGNIVQNDKTAVVDTVTSVVLDKKGVTLNFKGARPMTAAPDTLVEVYQ